MKRKLLTFGTAALFLIGASFITSCGNSQDVDNHEQHEHMDADGHNEMDHDKKDNTKDSDQTAAVYACPMHPEVTGNKGDKCSKCGMELKKVENEDHSGHDHD